MISLILANLALCEKKTATLLHLRGNMINCVRYTIVERGIDKVLCINRMSHSYFIWKPRCTFKYMNITYTSENSMGGCNQSKKLT